MRIALAQGRVQIVLHGVREAAREGAPNLLLLHELGGSSDTWRHEALDWDGAIYALDFTGHGQSDWLHSGAYYPELFLGDADIAHEHIESQGPSETCVLGRGVGGYVAMLLAGARRDRVRAAVVLPGAGFDGGGEEPPEYGRMEPRPPRGDRERNAFDPRVALIDEHMRPGAYSASFAARAHCLYFAEPTGIAPSWWTAATAVTPGRCSDSVKSALGALAAAPPIPAPEPA